MEKISEFYYILLNSYTIFILSAMNYIRCFFFFINLTELLLLYIIKQLYNVYLISYG